MTRAKSSEVRGQAGTAPRRSSRGLRSRKFLALIIVWPLMMMGSSATGPSHAAQNRSKWHVLTSSGTLMSQIAAQQQFPPISCGETKKGSIDQTDQTFSDGTHFDAYSFTTMQPNQPFIITAQSSSFPVQSALFFFDAQRGPFVFLQAISAGAPNMPVTYTGVLSTPGEYALVINGDSPQSAGPYTVMLECQACGASGGGCTGGTLDAPVQIQMNQELACELTSNDPQVQDQQGGVHFAKVFQFQSPGGSVRITATSSAFTPLIGALDPNTEQLSNVSTSPNTLNFPAGPAFFVVVANEVQATGPFTVKVEQGGTCPPFK